MNSRSPLRFRPSAFTLVELLTVIAIIAILMGLLFPAIQIVKDQANKVKAKSDIMNTVAAVKQYYTEYGKYPLTGQTTNTDITFGDSVSAAGAASPVDNSQLYNVLRNYAGATRGNPDGNPRQIVFFEGRTGITSSSGTGNPRGGFTPSIGSGYTGSAQQGAFYDPWGNEYAIAVDGTYDNYVPVPYVDFPAPQGSTSNLPVTCVNVGTAAWSVGKDGQLGTKGDSSFRNASTGSPSDDVISWQ
jgi:prepilin-type N-terminal cleavage/methylation domain-containing protein